MVSEMIAQNQVLFALATLQPHSQAAHCPAGNSLGCVLESDLPHGAEAMHEVPRSLQPFIPLTRGFWHTQHPLQHLSHTQLPRAHSDILRQDAAAVGTKPSVEWRGLGTLGSLRKGHTMSGSCRPDGGCH